MKINDLHMEESAPRLVLPFAAGEFRFAVDLLDIVEVVPAYALLRLPTAGGVVLGMLNYRGTVVPLLDPAHRCMERGGDVSTWQTYIVCGNAGASCALLADEVFDLVEATGNVGSTHQQSLASFSTVILVEEEPVPVLDIARLLEEMRADRLCIDVDEAQRFVEEVLP
ncbi:MAG TPA: chemotaxis protein CheW [Bacteroidota bacterium]|nr:chemotaxis protein CheW [Bacteroidota bacterium]